MTRELEIAVALANTLPDADQDAIASVILEEIKDWEMWDSAFEHTQPRLANLAQNAREDFKAGRVREMGIDEL